ncbi:hypothetical protein MKX03_019562 [Papaver bracteatum]|nr:hypothetical protein MKX03_019562 [Papaver bracteatum]
MKKASASSSIAKKGKESSSMNPVTPVSKPEKKNPITLPEKYEKSIRLLRMRRTMTTFTFTNVSRGVESLTKRFPTDLERALM